MTRRVRKLAKLLVKAERVMAAMTPEEKATLHRAQLISFTYGNIHLHDSRITLERVEELCDEHLAAKEQANEN